MICHLPICRAKAVLLMLILSCGVASRTDPYKACQHYMGFLQRSGPDVLCTKPFMVTWGHSRQGQSFARVHSMLFLFSLWDLATWGSSLLSALAGTTLPTYWPFCKTKRH